MKPGPGQAASWRSKAKQAQRAMAAARITQRLVSEDELSIGSEHRRLIVDHVRCHVNSPSGRLFYIMSFIGLMHCVQAEAFEYRDADGKLVAFALSTTFGGYMACSVYACHHSAARAGIWCVAAMRASASNNMTDQCHALQADKRDLYFGVDLTAPTCAPARCGRRAAREQARLRPAAAALLAFGAPCAAVVAHHAAAGGM